MGNVSAIDQLKTFIGNYELTEGDLKDTEITTSTRIGESIDSEGVKTVESVSVSTSLPLPQNFIALIKTIGLEKATYLLNDRVNRQISDNFRKPLRDAVDAQVAAFIKDNKGAKKADVVIDVDAIDYESVRATLTPDNWVSGLPSGAERVQGGKKIVEAMRKATEAERAKAIDNIVSTMGIMLGLNPKTDQDKILAAVTDVQKSAINSACGYIVF